MIDTARAVEECSVGYAEALSAKLDSLGFAEALLGATWRSWRADLPTPHPAPRRI